jgi:hypothetical protein
LQPSPFAVVFCTVTGDANGDRNGDGLGAEARKAATKFDSEKASKAAKAWHAADTKSCPPQKVDAKAKHERSTIGQVAAKAGTSMHKARRAVSVQKGM